MAKKPRSARLDYLIYLVVRTLVCILQALPVCMSRKFGLFLAWLAYHVDKRHREVARDNLYHAFPELRCTPRKCDRMVRDCYRHFCLMLMEMIMLPRKLHVGNWREMMSLVRGDSTLGGLLADRPLLIVTGHFGNWEMAGFAMGVFGFKTYAIARTLDNPYLEKFLKKFREKTGQTILAKRGDFDNITEVLASGGAIATLGDQDAGERGLFVPFLNRPASTHKAVALLALEFEAPMVVVGIPRVSLKPMHYHIIAEEVIDPRDYQGNPNAVRLITERFTSALERLIRRHPEQYFWLHRRWKHQPPQRKAKSAA